MPKRSTSPATSTQSARKRERSKESDEATSGKETPAKAPRTYSKPSRFTGALEPPTPSASKRPSSTNDYAADPLGSHGIGEAIHLLESLLELHVCPGRA